MKYYWRAIKARPFYSAIALYFFVRTAQTLDVELAEATFNDIFLFVAGPIVFVAHGVEIGRAVGKEKKRDQEAEERDIPPR